MSGNKRVFFDIEADGEKLGKIIMELRCDVTPRTCENFRALCTGEKGYGYKGSSFHRVIPNFMCQVSSHSVAPTKVPLEENSNLSNSSYSPGRRLHRRERHWRKVHLRNEVRGRELPAEAHRPWHPLHGQRRPRHHLCTAKTSWLDGKHVVFGQVVEGMDTVRKVESYGSKSGKTTKKIIVADCGEC